MRRSAAAAVLAMVVLAGSGCAAVPEAALPQAATTPAATAASPSFEAGTGARVADSFGNVLYYTTVQGDTLAGLAEVFKIPAKRLGLLNAVADGTPLAAGSVLRLIPPPGPIVGARGEAPLDALGIPQTYTVALNDGFAGVVARFGMSAE